MPKPTGSKPIGEIIEVNLRVAEKASLDVHLKAEEERVRKKIAASGKKVWYLECSSKMDGEERNYHPALIEAEEPSEAILLCTSWLEEKMMAEKDNSFQAKLYPQEEYAIKDVVWRSNPAGGGCLLRYYSSSGGKPDKFWGMKKNFVLILGQIPYFQKWDKEKRKYVSCLPEDCRDSPELVEDGLHYNWLKGYTFNSQSGEAYSSIRNAKANVIIVYCYKDCEPVLITPPNRIFKGLEAIQRGLNGSLVKNLINKSLQGPVTILTRVRK